MAFLTQQQVRDIIQGAPEGSDPRKILQGLMDRGHELEGFDEVAQSQEQPGFLKSTFQAITRPFSRTLAAGASSLEATGKLLSGQGAAAAQEALTREREVLGQTVRPLGVSEEGEVKEFGAHAADVVGTGLQLGSMLATPPAAGSFGTAAKAAFTGSTGTLKAVGTGAATGALLAGAEEAGRELQREGTTATDVLREGAIGATVGAVTGGILPALGGIAGKTLRASPKLSAILTGKPERVLQEAFDNPNVSNRAKEFANIGDDAAIDVLNNTQNSVKAYRTALSESWSDGVKKLADDFSGQRMGLNSRQQSTLTRIMDEYPLGFQGTDVPWNMNSFSLQEGLNLNAALNRLDSIKEVREGAAGHFVREFGSEFNDRLVNNFGGSQGPVRQFLNDYGTKSQIMNGMDDLIRSWNTGTKTRQSALNNLRRIFGDNKEIYMQAVNEFQEIAGVDLIEDIAAVTLAQNEQIGKMTGTTRVVQEFMKDFLMGVANIRPETLPTLSGRILRRVSQ